MKKIITGLLLTLALIAGSYAEEAPKSPSAVTTANPDVSAESLHLMVRHMTGDELFVEADGWLVLLKEAAKKVYDTKLSVQEKNDQIDALNAQDNNQTAAEEREGIKQKITVAKEEKDAILEEQTKLRAQRKTMVARLDTVLENINEKIGTDADGKELEKVLPYRRYIDTVSGISLEVTDAQSAWTTVSGWVMSDEGGIYWLINIAKFLAIIFMAMFISKLLSRGARKALEHTPSNSQLLNDFIANIIHKVVMLIGVLVALAALDVNVAPIMAMVGAAGFVVAFALQGTLSNFASGLMIMLYRPYDIGDVVDVAGIIGTVESMTLVSTSIVTADNRLMVVPNNSIWGNIITNVTHSDTRRVDMTFGIGYDDNIEQAQNVMEQILSEHPLVLKDPAPTIKVNELADSSVNFICRPWVKTADYWTVFWEVTRTVKERFDEEGISIPYPQSDLHIIGQNTETDRSENEHNKTTYTKKSHDTLDIKEMDVNDDQ
ncbi:mechanosensitive ion channel domain-containing protein [Sulfurovum sp. CS9]|uniref:mechanosensitive ion channel domain-containing protein n=1 Tax=Sulfurovum sp. CS9 TaxID=3391146 RepID=UPI0039EA3BA0